jgi:hypothetical protein
MDYYDQAFEQEDPLLFISVIKRLFSPISLYYAGYSKTL